MKLNWILIFSILLLSCEKEAPRRPVKAKSNTSLIQSVSLNQALVSQQNNLIERRIKEDSLIGFQRNSNGFWERNALEKEVKIYPKEGDEISYTYSVFDIFGNVIYSQTEMDTVKVIFGKQDEMIGVSESLQKMYEGQKLELILPYYKAYGVAGDGDRIGVNQALRIELELIEINK